MAEQELSLSQRRLQFPDQQRAVAIAQMDSGAAGAIGVAGNAIEHCRAQCPARGWSDL